MFKAFMMAKRNLPEIQLQKKLHFQKVLLCIGKADVSYGVALRR